MARLGTFNAVSLDTAALPNCLPINAASKALFQLYMCSVGAAGVRTRFRSAERRKLHKFVAGGDVDGLAGVIDQLPGLEILHHRRNATTSA